MSNEPIVEAIGSTRIVGPALQVNQAEYFRNTFRDFSRERGLMNKREVSFRKLSRSADDETLEGKRLYRKYPAATKLGIFLRGFLLEGIARGDRKEELRLYDEWRRLLDEFTDPFFYLHSSVGIRVPGRELFGMPMYIPTISKENWERSKDLIGSSWVPWKERIKYLKAQLQVLDPKVLDFAQIQARRQMLGQTFYFDNDGVHWVERFGAEQGAWKYRTASWSKFLRGLRHKYGFQADDEAIAQWSEAAGVIFKKPKVSIVEAGRERVVETYRERYFNSCMQDSPAVDFYTYQNVGILRCEDEESGELLGRALIWYDAYDEHNEEPRVLLDRIYPSNSGAHIDAMIKYAEKQGWLYKAEQCVHGEVGPTHREMSVVVENTGHFPYMDTFHYSEEFDYTDEGEKICLFNWSNRDHDVPWDRTDDMPPTEDEGIVRCVQCGDRRHWDYMIETLDGDVCENCQHMYEENLEGQWVNTDEVNHDFGWVRAVNAGGAAIREHTALYNEAADEYYADPGYYSWYDMEFEVAEATAGLYSGSWFPVDELVCPDEDEDDWYWINDPKLPEHESED